MVRNKALVAGAARWLDDLPGFIASLERDWQITVGRPFPDATEAFVAEAVPSAETGPSSVLKLMIPRAGDHARNEIAPRRFRLASPATALAAAAVVLALMIAEFPWPSRSAGWCRWSAKRSATGARPASAVSS